MGQGFGDRLARGGSKAAFSTSGSKISDKTWDEAFGDFDAEKFRGDADISKTGVSGSQSGKDKRTRK